MRRAKAGSPGSRRGRPAGLRGRPEAGSRLTAHGEGAARRGACRSGLGAARFPRAFRGAALAGCGKVGGRAQRTLAAGATCRITFRPRAPHVAGGSRDDGGELRTERAVGAARPARRASGGRARGPGSRRARRLSYPTIRWHRASPGWIHRRFCPRLRSRCSPVPRGGVHDRDAGFPGRAPGGGSACPHREPGLQAPFDSGRCRPGSSAGSIRVLTLVRPQENW